MIVVVSTGCEQLVGNIQNYSNLNQVHFGTVDESGDSYVLFTSKHMTIGLGSDYSSAVDYCFQI